MSTCSLVAPTDCTVVAVEAPAGTTVAAGATVVIVEMMKIEHLVTSPVAGTVTHIDVIPGQVLTAGTQIGVVNPQARTTSEHHIEPAAPTSAADRDDLANYRERRALLGDDARPEAVAKVHGRNRRTARENIADLIDLDSFEEYGSFMYAGQTRRRDVDELIRTTPGDGIIGGLARINGAQFGAEAASCAVMSYDYMVLAGTQGFRGHQKKDRLLEVVDRLQVPVVLFAEGGGGRPGDTDAMSLAGLELMSFAWMARLSGAVPSVAVVSGRCFAGNAALAAVCDAIIATPDANLGMAGPAMIEGGGLGTFSPEEIGPVDVQTENGVIDLLADDEAHAVALTKQYLSYFQGDLGDGTAPDSAGLRTLVPENRKRVYDVRQAVDLIFDTGSVLELRPTFGRSIATCLARIDGRAVGVLANDPAHLGGAIDADSADKAARFMQLCDGHGLPMVTLCDTPGFMVGPEAEKTAQVRHFGRMFVAGASVSVPTVTIVLRKAVGLGAMAMSFGSFHASLGTFAWPTTEVSGMGIEGAVRLGSKRELEAEPDGDAREALFDQLVARMYAHANAFNAAAHHEVDDVIDPADTRRRILALLRAAPATQKRTRPFIDTW